jgi:hypothetical protein
VTSPTGVPRELLSDENDADQSGVGDTEDAGDLSTGRDDSDEKQRKTSAHPSDHLQLLLMRRAWQTKRMTRRKKKKQKKTNRMRSIQK